MLTRSQLRRLRKAPQDGPNKLKLAIALAETTQMQVSEGIGIAQSQISEDAAGKFSEISLEKARAYASFFGCDVEDLFPARQAVAS